MSLLLTLLLIFTRFSNIYIVNFEHVIAGWVTDVYNYDSQTVIARFFLNDDRNTKNISKKKKRKKNSSQKYFTFSCFYQWCEHQVVNLGEAIGGLQ